MIWLIPGLLLLIAAAEALSLRLLPEHVTALTKPLCRTAEPGEAFLLETVLQNTSHLPATYLQVTERIPASAVTDDEKTGMAGRSSAISRSVGDGNVIYKTWLMPRQQYTHHTRLQIHERGRYTFHGCHLLIGDFLGLKTAGRSCERHEEIVIFPKALDSISMDDMLGGYLGEISVHRFLLEDPMLTMGLQEYTGREPFRAINWKQTAHRQQTMVNLYDHTTDPTAALILNLEYAARYEMDAAVLEMTLSCARSVVELLEARRIRYSFYSNILTAGALGAWLYTPEGLGRAHRDDILEGLGRATYDTAESAPVLLQRVQRQMDRGCGCIILTPAAPIPDSAFQKELIDHARRIAVRSGYPAAVLAVSAAGEVQRWL